MRRDFQRSILSDIDMWCEKQQSNLELFKKKYAKDNYSFIDKLTAHGIHLIIKSFPNDIGVFFPFILNVVVSEPGLAIEMQAGTLHAYLEITLFVQLWHLNLLMLKLYCVLWTSNLSHQNILN